MHQTDKHEIPGSDESWPDLPLLRFERNGFVDVILTRARKLDNEEQKAAVDALE